jgi:hypothetical protein
MAAGLGFKTFTTGEVLTAADTNGYLMQGVLVFASAAARDAAITSPQEGQCCYLKDTDAVLTYSGSAWVGFDDSNAIQNSIVDAKGDLVAASGADTPARLAVGNNGETLVADSSATTGLRYQSNFAAGKNKIINGDFGIWQRGTSFATAGGFLADRYRYDADGSGVTRAQSQQTFTPATAPVAGYEGQYFLRMNQSVAGTGATYNSLAQAIEDVRTFAGQTVTVSFWAKAAATTTIPTVKLNQNFGSGGSGLVSTTVTSSISVTTSWTRFSYSVAVPSISGKTIGTSSYLNLVIDLPLNATFTLDFWGVQVEAGSVATAFQTATGTIQGELAACRYYFERISPNAAGNGYSGVGHYYTTTQCYTVQYWEQKRVTPTTTNSNASGFTANSAGVNRTSTATAADQITTWGMDYSITTSAVTLGASAIVGPIFGTYIDVSAEL